MSKGLSTILLILIILAVGILAAIGGYYYGVKVATPTTTTTTSKITTTAVGAITTTTAVNTANWKTYTNDQYGFSFKYPGDWKTISRTSTEEKKQGIDVNGFSINSKLDEAPINFYTYPEPFDKVLTSRLSNNDNFEKDLTVNGKTAKSYTYKSVEGPHAGKTDNRIVVINISDQKAIIMTTEIDGNYDLIFNQILSTFTFTK